MATGIIRKITDKSVCVAVQRNDRTFQTELVYLPKHEDDAVGAVIEIESGYTIIDFMVWDPETESMVNATTRDGVNLKTLTWD